MTGKIPPYGENFRHARVGSYHPVLSDTIYVLKVDNEWFIRSDKPSKRWYVFHGKNRDMATHMGKVLPNMRSAMKLLLDGIDQGFYDTIYATTPKTVHDADCGLQGSGLDESCTCGVDAR
jgi:hypothetical protein